MLSASIWDVVWLTHKGEFMIEDSVNARSHLTYTHCVAKISLFFEFQDLQPSYKIHCKGFLSIYQLKKESGNMRGTEEKPRFWMQPDIFPCVEWFSDTHFAKCLRMETQTPGPVTFLTTSTQRWIHLRIITNVHWLHLYIL